MKKLNRRNFIKLALTAVAAVVAVKPKVLDAEPKKEPRKVYVGQDVHIGIKKPDGEIEWIDMKTIGIGDYLTPPITFPEPAEDIDISDMLGRTWTVKAYYSDYPDYPLIGPNAGKNSGDEYTIVI
jgi:hypothetical protein